MRETKGITLVALIITIIVLIILAGVTINLLFNSEGILNKAKEGADSWKAAEQDEIAQLAKLDNDLNSSVGGDSTQGPQVKKNGDWDEIKGVNSPDIEGELKPIYHNGTDWVELTASSSSEEWDNWYNYEIQPSTTQTGGTSKWANAKTTNGSMLVWIPRYEYKIVTGYHMSSAGIIDANFITKETMTPTDGYIIHPAFTNSGNGGLGELSGIWVGKFESSSENGQGGINGDNVKIVPNANPWREINLSTMFAKSKEFASNNNISQYDSHMMKNSEWGAVAYLAYSKYGRNKTEVTINNKYDGNDRITLRTGYAGYTVSATYNNTERAADDTSSTTGVFPYNNTYRGVLASTTGNIYGIYDMSGGAMEYVMGNFNNTIHTSGFVELPASKYFDNYTGYSSSYKGDAVYETGAGATSTGWRDDFGYFVDSNSPWFVRGGLYDAGASAGLFAFSRSTGAGNGQRSFRVVCAK